VKKTDSYKTFVGLNPQLRGCIKYSIEQPNVKIDYLRAFSINKCRVKALFGQVRLMHLIFYFKRIRNQLNPTR